MFPLGTGGSGNTAKSFEAAAHAVKSRLPVRLKAALTPRLPCQATVSRCLPLFYWIVAMYQSDVTQFIEQLKAQKPSLEAEQRAGRSLLWDKQPVDLDESQRQQQSRVEQTPYVYYQKF